MKVSAEARRAGRLEPDEVRDACERLRSLGHVVVEGVFAPDLVSELRAAAEKLMRTKVSPTGQRNVWAPRERPFNQPGVASKVLDRLAELSRRDAAAPVQEILSAREIEVVQLMARGEANKGIAASLSISESTVKTHIANIFSKLDVNHRTEAVTQALQKGIIKL